MAGDCGGVELDGWRIILIVDRDNVVRQRLGGLLGFHGVSIDRDPRGLLVLLAILTVSPYVVVFRVVMILHGD